MIAAFAAHGAAFAAVRVPDGAASTAGAMIRPRVATAALLAAVLVVTSPLLVDGGVRPAALALLVVGAGAFTAVAVTTARRGEVAALALTGLGLVTSVFAVGVQVAPWLRTGAASDRTLDLLATVLLPVVAVMLLVQLATAWLFRKRVDETSAVFY